MKTEELVIVGTYVDTLDAEAAAGVLAAAGIDVVEKRDDDVQVRPEMWLHSVEIVMRSDDAEHALDLLRWASSLSAGDFVEG
jgi:hypothetical protein